MIKKKKVFLIQFSARSAENTNKYFTAWLMLPGTNFNESHFNAVIQALNCQSYD